MAQMNSWEMHQRIVRLERLMISIAETGHNQQTNEILNDLRKDLGVPAVLYGEEVR